MYTHVYKKTYFFTEPQYSSFFSFLSLRSCSYIEGVTASKNQRIIFKSFLMSYFVIKQNESGTE